MIHAGGMMTDQLIIDLAKDTYEIEQRNLLRTSRLSPRWPGRFRALTAAAQTHADVSGRTITLPQTNAHYLLFYLVRLGVVLGTLLVLVFIFGGAYLLVKDSSTLDPMPEGVTQHGFTFYVKPGVRDSHAKATTLCLRLQYEDGLHHGQRPDYVPASVKPYGDGIEVVCEYKRNK